MRVGTARGVGRQVWVFRESAAGVCRVDLAASCERTLVRAVFGNWPEVGRQIKPDPENEVCQEVR
jgi:hypothetical protein